MVSSWVSLILAVVATPVVLAKDVSASAALADMPGCAVGCFAKLITDSACSLTNQTCLCADTHFQQVVSVCVTQDCTIKEAITTRNLTATVCGEPIRDKGQEYVNISNAFGIISGIFVMQRFGYKIWMKLDIGIDDWFTLVTIVSGIPSTVINAYGITPNGMGRDTWTLSFDDITDFGRFFFYMAIIYYFEVACLKLSLLFFYIRIFPAAPVRRLLWGTIILTAMFGLSFVIVSIFQCRPVHYYWTKWDGEHNGTCLNINTLAWSNAGISIGLDIWMLGIPLWQLKNLSLDWKKKLGVGLMFCVGTFVTVVSILRLKSLVNYGADSLNPTWDYFDIGMWSTIEINVGIICTCLPSLRLLLVRLFPNIMGSTRRYYSRYASNNQRSSARRGSRPAAASSVSRVERIRHHHDGDPKSIRCQKSYTVEYGDNDEVELVQVKELDMKSARSVES